MPRMLKPPHLLYLENAPNTIKAQSRHGDSISKAAEGVDASQAITAGAHLRAGPASQIVGRVSIALKVEFVHDPAIAELIIVPSEGS